MRQAMGFLDKAPSQEDKVELIKTLQSITEGKVCQSFITPWAGMQWRRGAMLSCMRLLRCAGVGGASLLYERVLPFGRLCEACH